MAQFCKHCGAALGVDADFCGQCGNGQAAAVVHPAMAERRGRPVWLWIALAALIPVAGAGLAVQQGWITRSGLERSADTDGNGMIDSAEIGREIARIPQFRAGRWNATSNFVFIRPNGRREEDGHRQPMDVRETNFRPLRLIFDDLLLLQRDRKVITAELQMAEGLQGCSIGRLRAEADRVEMEVVCNSGASLKLTGTVATDRFDVRYDGRNIGRVAFLTGTRTGRWVADFNEK